VILDEGKFFKDAAEFASAAVAISVTLVGVQPSLPTYAEVAKFIEEGNRII
jgi:sugar/nucleoside kinase (ribokinase family)